MGMNMKNPSKEVDGTPKTLRMEFHTTLASEDMKPELIWFTQIKVHNCFCTSTL